MVSELDYLLLEHVAFSDDLNFCLWQILRQGGSSQILDCFDIDWNKSSPNNEGFHWCKYFHALGFQLLPILDFSFYGISVLNVKSWEGVEYDMV